MLKIRNLTVDHRLLNVSMEITHFFGIIGPNGAGKSTLLKAISGLTPTDTGAITYHGQNLRDLDRTALSRLVHLVPQGPRINFDYTAKDIVSMGCYHRDNIEESLNAVDALHLLNRPITQLSMGERQRIYLARALATECPILLFDEPTSNLDIRHQLEIWELLKGLEGKTIVITHHDLQMTARYCPRIALINQGQCLSYGKVEDVLTTDEIKTTFGVCLDEQGYRLV